MVDRACLRAFGGDTEGRNVSPITVMMNLVGESEQKRSELEISK
jgi:hypothetical protein